MVDPAMVVTFDRLDGYRIVKRCGKVRGVASCSRNVLRAALHAMGSLVGVGPAVIVTDAESVRGECLAALLGDAERLGANSVVGVRFEVTGARDGSTRVRAVGDAVILEAERQPA